jgi:tetratricopeptide (TPR) repeat protein
MVVSNGADVRRGREIHREALRYIDRFGLVWHARWVRAELAIGAYRLGDWQEAVALAEQEIEEAGRTPHYMEGAGRFVRALIRAARGDSDGARGDTLRALELARGIGDPQAFEPTLAGTAYVLAQVGSTEDARGLIEELNALVATGDRPVDEPWYALEFALALRACDGDRSGFDAARGRRRDSPWFDAAAAYLDGEFERAADLMYEIGSLVHEAAARVAAAEAYLAAGHRAEASEQLMRALAFYRGVRATAFIAQAERLLPAAV